MRKNIQPKDEFKINPLYSYLIHIQLLEADSCENFLADFLEATEYCTL